MQVPSAPLFIGCKCYPRRFFFVGCKCHPRRFLLEIGLLSVPVSRPIKKRTAFCRFQVRRAAFCRLQVSSPPLFVGCKSRPRRFWLAASFIRVAIHSVQVLFSLEAILSVYIFWIALFFLFSCCFHHDY